MPLIMLGALWKNVSLSKWRFLHLLNYHIGLQIILTIKLRMVNILWVRISIFYRPPIFLVCILNFTPTHIPHKFICPYCCYVGLIQVYLICMIKRIVHAKFVSRKWWCLILLKSILERKLFFNSKIQNWPSSTCMNWISLCWSLLNAHYFLIQ